MVNVFEMFLVENLRLAKGLKSLGEIVPLPDRENMWLFSRLFTEIGDDLETTMRDRRPGAKKHFKRWLNLSADLNGSVTNWLNAYGYDKFMRRQIKDLVDAANDATSACRIIVGLIHQKIHG
jgi:hypothetical protein